jgi:hypothetical protein
MIAFQLQSNESTLISAVEAINHQLLPKASESPVEDSAKRPRDFYLFFMSILKQAKDLIKLIKQLAM